jgi:hypothetical protein
MLSPVVPMPTSPRSRTMRVRYDGGSLPLPTARRGSTAIAGR